MRRVLTEERGTAVVLTLGFMIFLRQGIVPSLSAALAGRRT